MAQKPLASTNPEKAEGVKMTNPAAAATPELTPERRDKLAGQVIDRFALWSGAAGFIPMPGVDLLAVGGVQVQLLRRLSQIYGVPFSENRGKALIASLAGSAIPATSAAGAASALKVVPIVGTVVSTFIMPVLSAGATYAVGKAFAKHFESGGTLLDFNPPDYRELIKAQKEKWRSRSKGSTSESSSSGAVDSTAGAAATNS